MRTTALWMSVAGVGLGLMLAGCSGQTAEPQASVGTDGAQYLLASAPEGASEIVAAKETVKDGDEVTLVGRIGGKIDPWIDGMAAFTIVDSSLRACSDIPGDKCPTPWDYCCESDVGAGSALVQLVDDSGEPVMANAKELLNVTELSTVYVTGKAQRDEAGNLTVLASKLYVKPGSGHTGEKKGDGEHGHSHDHEHDHESEHGEKDRQDDAEKPAAEGEQPAEEAAPAN